MKTVAITTSVFSGAAIGSIALELFGVPLSVLLAGFAGSVVALAYMPSMERWRLFSAVTIGTLFAAYGTLLIVHLFGWPDKVHIAVSFFGGVLGHSVLTFFYSPDARNILKGWISKPGANP